MFEKMGMLWAFFAVFRSPVARWTGNTARLPRYCIRAAFSFIFCTQKTAQLRLLSQTSDFIGIRSELFLYFFAMMSIMLSCCCISQGTASFNVTTTLIPLESCVALAFANGVLKYDMSSSRLLLDTASLVLFM